MMTGEINDSSSSSSPPPALTWALSVAQFHHIRSSSRLYLPPIAVDSFTQRSVQCSFNPVAWLAALQQYPDQVCAQVMLTGMRQGVDIRFAVDGSRDGPHSRRNLPWPAGREREAEEFVEKELSGDAAAGRRAGPFSSSPFPVYRISPFGVVTKKGSSKLRLIHHLSWPRHSLSHKSVNSSIEQLHCPLASFEDAVSMLNDMGDLSDVWMFKVDVKSAYRCIPVRPADWPLLGGQWKGKLYFDMSLPFGMASSCACWECYATAIEWMTRKYVSLDRRLIHYIDDFFGAERGKQEAQRKLTKMLHLFQLLGVPVSAEKVEGPHQCMTFLGIMIDIKSRQLLLDTSKLQQLQQMLAEWETRTRCSRKDLQSLAGSLYWATRVIRGGRTFLRRIVSAMRHRSHEFSQPIEHSVRGDLKWWSRFMQQYNGVSMLPESKWTESWSTECSLFTDACKTGYGAVWGKDYLYGQWSPQQLDRASGSEAIVISVLELAAIVIAAKSWGKKWEGKRIRVRSDNTAAVTAINTGACQDDRMMELAREMWFISCTHAFELHAVHVAGAANINADDLSRGRVSQFLLRNPTASSSPTTTQLPECLSL